MKKSDVLVALPNGVVTEIRPEPACGTLAPMLVPVDDVTVPFTILNAARSFATTVSKLVPLIVTAVPGTPIVGVNPLMVGAPAGPVVTVNELELVTEPIGDVTDIVPVVAPVGTLVTIKLVLDAVILAETPLNVTVF